jgi:hypothetical protein
LWLTRTTGFLPGDKLLTAGTEFGFGPQAVPLGAVEVWAAPLSLDGRLKGATIQTWVGLVAGIKLDRNTPAVLGPEEWLQLRASAGRLPLDQRQELPRFEHLPSRPPTPVVPLELALEKRPSQPRKAAPPWEDPDATVCLYMEKLGQSKVGQAVLTEFAAWSHNRLGLDIGPKALRRVTLVTKGGPDFTLLIEMQDDLAFFLGMLQGPDAGKAPVKIQRQRHEGRALFEITGLGNRDTLYAGQLDKRTLVVCSQREALLNLLREDVRGGLVGWLKGRKPNAPVLEVEIKGSSLSPAFLDAERWKSVASVFVGANLTDMFSGQIRLVAVAGKTGKDVQEAAQGIKNFADPFLTGLGQNGMGVHVEGNAVRLEWALPASELLPRLKLLGAALP